MAASALLQAGQRSASIAREAVKTGACYFCIGALLGVRNPVFYSLPSSHVQGGLANYLSAASPQLGDEPVFPASATPETCPVCLGILQHHSLQHDATCASKSAPAAAAEGAAAASPASHPTSAAHALMSAIKLRQYDSRRFHIGVRVPTSVAVRQHALR
jgi:hypothetical protein